MLNAFIEDYLKDAGLTDDQFQKFGMRIYCTPLNKQV